VEGISANCKNLFFSSYLIINPSLLQIEITSGLLPFFILCASRHTKAKHIFENKISLSENFYDAPLYDIIPQQRKCLWEI